MPSLPLRYINTDKVSTSLFVKKENSMVESKIRNLTQLKSLHLQCGLITKPSWLRQRCKRTSLRHQSSGLFVEELRPNTRSYSSSSLRSWKSNSALGGVKCGMCLGAILSSRDPPYMT